MRRLGTQQLAASGTAGAPIWSFSADATSGHYLVSLGVIGLAIRGVQLLRYGAGYAASGVGLRYGANADSDTFTIGAGAAAVTVPHYGWTTGQGALNGGNGCHISGYFGVVFYQGGAARWIVDGSNFGPASDNAFSLGTGSRRISDLYLVNNPTVSSDAALKTARASSAGGPALTAAELAAWAKVSPSVWSLNSDTSGLLHIGYIAQAVQAAFAAQGLDITKYALWRQDAMPDGSTRSALVYAECAVFEAAYQRQQVGLLTRQIAAVAKLLNLTLPTL